MGIYSKHVLPFLTDWAMGQEALSGYRSRVVTAAEGRILEIGIGSGRNLPFYSDDADEVVGLDPSAELLGLACRVTGRRSHRVRLVQGSAEAIPFCVGTFDAVVMTWSLCSIPDPLAALGEVRRVLRPGGRLLFAEHGASPDTRIRRWQDGLTPLWRRCAGGCHLNRKPDDLIRAGGFRLDRIEVGYASGIKPLAFMYEGLAVPM